MPRPMKGGCCGGLLDKTNTGSAVWADTAYRSKARMDLFIRTIGLARAETKIGLANLVYNIKRLITLEAGKTAPA